MRFASAARSRATVSDSEIAVGPVPIHAQVAFTPDPVSRGAPCGMSRRFRHNTPQDAATRRTTKNQLDSTNRAHGQICVCVKYICVRQKNVWTGGWWINYSFSDRVVNELYAYKIPFSSLISFYVSAWLEKWRNNYDGLRKISWRSPEIRHLIHFDVKVLQKRRKFFFKKMREGGQSD